MASEKINEPQTPDPGRERRRKRLMLILLLAALCLFALLEGGARLWLHYGKGVPLNRPSALILSYYPEMREAMMTNIARGDKNFDVLILSGSAFFDYYGAPGLQLKRALENAGYKNVRIWNMARSAHGSQDSLIKYRWLKDRRFDWVIVYHGFNELRTNNVPKKEFRGDYSHLAWYAEVNAMVDKPHERLALPALVDFLHYKINNLRRPPSSILYDQAPSAAAAEYGSAIQSAPTFRKNLKEIATIAKKRHENISLVTYAAYLDPKYTPAAFEHDKAVKLAMKEKHTSGTLQLSYAVADYADYAMPCEVWGKPANLMAGIRQHNEETRGVAHKMHVKLVDFATSLSARGEYFVDVCHLSPTGIEQMVRTLLANAPPKDNKFNSPAPGAAPVAAPAKSAAPATTKAPAVTKAPSMPAVKQAPGVSSATAAPPAAPKPTGAARK